jgi:hypothetical protein
MVDDEIVLDMIRRARNGAEFSRLYDSGDWESFVKPDGSPLYNSQPEAAMALVAVLGFLETAR